MREDFVSRLMLNGDVYGQRSRDRLVEACCESIVLMWYAFVHRWIVLLYSSIPSIPSSDFAVA